MKCNPENDKHTEECIKSNLSNCIELVDDVELASFLQRMDKNPYKKGLN